MMKLYNLTRPGALFRTLDQCEEPVRFAVAGRYPALWHEIRHLVYPACAGAPLLRQVEVCCSSPQDLNRVLRFSMEAAVGRPQPGGA